MDTKTLTRSAAALLGAAAAVTPPALLLTASPASAVSACTPTSDGVAQETVNIPAGDNGTTGLLTLYMNPAGCWWAAIATTADTLPNGMNLGSATLYVGNNQNVGYCQTSPGGRKCVTPGSRDGSPHFAYGAIANGVPGHTGNH